MVAVDRVDAPPPRLPTEVDQPPVETGDAGEKRTVDTAETPRPNFPKTVTDMSPIVAEDPDRVATVPGDAEKPMSPDELETVLELPGVKPPPIPERARTPSKPLPTIPDEPSPYAGDDSMDDGLLARRRYGPLVAGAVLVVGGLWALFRFVL